MRTVTLVLGDFEGTVEGDVIGVDYGALVCLNKGIPVMLACGDFDSVSEEDFQRIKNYADTTIRLNPMKDDTDFLFAYKQAGNYDEIIVYDINDVSKDDYENFFMFCENVGFEENYVTYARL